MVRFLFSIGGGYPDLKSLAEKTGRSTEEEVIRDAMTLYQYLLLSHESGVKIFVGKNCGDVSELKIACFPPRSKESKFG